MTYPQAASFFGLKSVTLWRQIIRGFCGLSLSRAEEWERLTKGELRVLDLLKWHERNRRAKSKARKKKSKRKQPASPVPDPTVTAQLKRQTARKAGRRAAGAA